MLIRISRGHFRSRFLCIFSRNFLRRPVLFRKSRNPPSDPPEENAEVFSSSSAKSAFSPSVFPIKLRSSKPCPVVFSFPIPTEAGVPACFSHSPAAFRGFETIPCGVFAVVEPLFRRRSFFLRRLFRLFRTHAEPSKNSSRVGRSNPSSEKKSSFSSRNAEKSSPERLKLGYRDRRIRFSRRGNRSRLIVKPGFIKSAGTPETAFLSEPDLGKFRTAFAVFFVHKKTSQFHRPRARGCLSV